MLFLAIYFVAVEFLKFSPAFFLRWILFVVLDQFRPHEAQEPEVVQGVLNAFVLYSLSAVFESEVCPSEDLIEHAHENHDLAEFVLSLYL